MPAENYIQMKMIQPLVPVIFSTSEMPLKNMALGRPWEISDNAAAL